MTREKLFKKWNSHPEHGYDLEETYNEATMIDGRPIDISFILSGRNRGKSFTICTKCLADAWYDDRQFAYVRRHDSTVYETEQYFADKYDFISDMTDGEADRIIRYKGKLYFARIDVDEDNNEHKVMIKECGQFFNLNRNSAYKSLQYPNIFNLFYEEVMSSDEPYLQNEPNKLLNLISTIKRNKEGFNVYLISNLISPVSPYSTEWGINIGSLKPDNINVVKLYLGSYDSDGNEKFLIIACHYLKDRGDLSKEDLKNHKRNRVRTGIESNRWDEATLYPTLPFNFLKGRAEKLDRCVFEWDDIMFLVDILEVPENIRAIYDDETTKPTEYTMPILYIQRKTTEPYSDTRLYTNNPVRFGPYVSRGFQNIYLIDKIVEQLLIRGYLFAADNLTANSFKTVYDNLKTFKYRV